MSGRLRTINPGATEDRWEGGIGLAGGPSNRRAPGAAATGRREHA